MSDGAHPHHGFDYIEIAATDMAASRAFYAAAFGWQFTEYAPVYLGIQRPGGGEMGGLCKAEDERVGGGGPLVILYSADLDATLAAVQRAGGLIVKPIFDFPGGRRFHFVDPCGNELAVWTKAG
ncbi:MAG: VOC family protein [Myxococcales bacterium]|nr:VOC family protein [Myxococcales bacterium]